MHVKQIRLPKRLLSALHDKAKGKGNSFAVEVRGALSPYVQGQEPFPSKSPEDDVKPTTFPWSEEEDNKFKELCKQNNIKFDEAMRYIIHKHLESDK